MWVVKNTKLKWRKWEGRKERRTIVGRKGRYQESRKNIKRRKENCSRLPWKVISKEKNNRFCELKESKEIETISLKRDTKIIERI